MGVYRDKFIAHSQKNRRCVGCDNFVTIHVGDPYYSCWFAEGKDAGSYAMCAKCYDHLNDCDSCMEAMRDNGEVPTTIRECREQLTAEENKQMNDDVIGAPGFDQSSEVRGGCCDPDAMEVWALTHGYHIECQTEDACDGIVLVSDNWIIELDEDGQYTCCLNTPNMLSRICDSYRVECELRRMPEVD